RPRDGANLRDDGRPDRQTSRNEAFSPCHWIVSEVRLGGPPMRGLCGKVEGLSERPLEAGRSEEATASQIKSRSRVLTAGRRSKPSHAPSSSHLVSSAARPAGVPTKNGEAPVPSAAS